MLMMWRLCLVTGGVREALFGDENYPIMWGKRQGFAKAAIQANVVRHQNMDSLPFLEFCMFYVIWFSFSDCY